MSKSWLFGSFWNVTQTSTHFLKVKTEQSRFSPKLQNIIWLRLRPWLRWAPSRKLFLCSGKGGLGSTKFVAFETLAWHNECFFCNQCKVSMVGKGFIQVMIKTSWNGLEVAYIRIDEAQSLTLDWLEERLNIYWLWLKFTLEITKIFQINFLLFRMEKISSAQSVLAVTWTKMQSR